MTQQANGEGERRPWRLRRLPRKLRRRALWSIAIVAALAAAVVFGPPAAIRYAAEAWLEAQGATQVSVGRVEVGLWSARVQLEGIKAAGADDPGVAFDRLVASIELPPLLDRQVILRGLVLDGVDTTLSRDSEGRWRVGGIALGARSAAASGAEKADHSQETADGWQFGVRALELRRARIAVRAFGVDDTLTVKRLQLANLVAWDAASPLTIEADMGLGEAKLGARASARPFGEEPAARIEIEVSALALEKLAPLVQRFGVTRLDGQGQVRATLTATDRPSGLGLGFKGVVGLDRASLRADGRAVDLEGLAWDGDLSLDLAGGTALLGTIEGRLSADRFRTSADDTKVEASALGWTLAWTVKRGAGATAVEATGTGEARGGRLTVSGGGAPGAISLDGFRWNGRTDLMIDPGRTLYGYLDGGLALNRPRGQAAAGAIAATSAAWRGWLTASQTGQRNDIGLMMRAEVTADDLAIRLPDRGLDGQARAATWRGHVELETWDGAPELHGSTDGQVLLSDATLDDTRRGLRLVSAARATSSGLAVGLRGDVFVRDLDAERVTLLTPRAGARSRPGDPLLAARSLFVEHVGLTAEGLRIAELRLDGAAVSLVHEGGGRLGGIDAFEDAAAPDRNNDDAGRERGPPLVAVGPVHVTGDSTVRVTDRGVRPRVRAELAPFNLMVGRINRLQPAADTAVRLETTIKPHAKVAISGKVRPFAQRLTLSLDGRIQALDLAPLSGYAEKRLGFSLRTGQLDGETSVKIDGGRIDGVGKATVRQLALDLLDTPEARTLAGALPVSLDTALDLLRDDRNSIRVTVPVTGDIEDPQFDLSETINRAIGRAIGQTVRTTLTVLFPVGAIASAIIDSASSESELLLAPLGFTAGNSELDGKASSYLDQLARLLNERPRVRVSLCGAATESDWAILLPDVQARRQAPARQGDAAKDAAQPQATRPQVEQTPVPPEVRDARLSRLAEARAGTVRRYLVERHEVDSQRLASCKPSVDRTEGAQPRVDVRL